MKGTIQEAIKAVYSLLPQSLSAATHAGTGVDCKGFGEALVVIMAGATSTNGSHAFKVQESSDDGVGDAYADITDATFTAITTENDEAVYVGRLNLRERERYIRVYDTGTNQALLASALIVLSQPQLAPISQVATVAFNL